MAKKSGKPAKDGELSMSGKTRPQTRQECPLCSRIDQTILWHSSEYLITQCNTCGLLKKFWLDPDKQRYKTVIEDLYHDVEARVSNPIFEKIARDRLKLLTRFVTHGKLLEVGCGTGEFIRLASSYGFNAMGVDLSQPFCAYAQQRGLNILHGTIESLGFNQPEFDIAAMFHLIEHIENPVSFLHHIWLNLRPRGLIYLATPNRDSTTERPFGFHHPNWHQPDHLFFYSATTLCHLLRKTGFKPISITSNEYRYHFFTSVIGLLGNLVKDNLPALFESYQKYSQPGVQTDRGKTLNQIPIKLIHFVMRRSPFLLADLLYPFLEPYSLLLESLVRGHELIIIGRKS